MAIRPGTSPDPQNAVYSPRNAGRPGRGVLLLGLLAVGIDACPRGGPVSAIEAGEPVEVRLERLEGQAFRLLPGVGPVLAERLEQARLEAGGVLDPEAAGAVRGVGPALLGHWDRMRSR